VAAVIITGGRGREQIDSLAGLAVRQLRHRSGLRAMTRICGDCDKLLITPSVMPSLR